jgi:hypothetical protein
LQNKENDESCYSTAEMPQMNLIAKNAAKNNFNVTTGEKLTNLSINKHSLM